MNPKRTETHPEWWQLYLLGVGAIGLLVLGARAHLSNRGHEEAVIGVLVLVCGLIYLWLGANWRGLLYTDRIMLVPQPETEKWDETDPQHTGILVSQPEPDQPEEPKPADASPSGRGTCA